MLNRHLDGNDVCGTMLVGFGCDSKNPERQWEVILPNVPKPPLETINEPVSF